MRSVIAAFSFMALLLGAGLSADAQERRGFWIGAGVSLGSAEVSAAGVDPERNRVSVVDVAAGWTLSPRLLIGAEGNSFSVTFFDGVASQQAGIIDLAAIVSYYPRASSGFFVKGGVGPTFADDLEDSPTLDVTGRGVGGIIGTGYDIYIGRNFSLTTAVDVRFSRIAEVRLDERPGFRNWRHNVIEFTVGIKFN